MNGKLKEIIELEREGYRATALRRLSRFLADNPDSAEGWYYMARFHNKPAKQYDAVQQALSLEPEYAQALEFRSILLEEHPELETNNLPKLIILVTLLIGGTFGLSLLAIFGIPMLFEESDPDVVVVVPPTEDVPTEEAPVIVVTDTVVAITPTFTLPPPTATTEPDTPTVTPLPVVTIITTLQRFASATPLSITPTAIPQPTSTDDIPLVLVTGGLQVEPVSGLRIENSDATVETTDNATALAAENSASMVINQNDDGVQIYAWDMTEPYLPEWVGLARLFSPWEINLVADDVEAVEAILGYMAYQPQTVIDRLAPRFDNLAQNLETDDAYLAAMLAYSYLAVDDAEAALPIYDLLNASDPLDASIPANRARAIAETGDPQSAIALYATLLDSYPEPAFIQSNIGDVYVLDNANTALLAYDEAAQLAPDSPRPFLGRAGVALQQGDLETALAEYTAAIERNSDYIPALLARARLNLQLDLLTDALNDVNQAIDLQPSIGAFYAVRGEILLADEQWSDAANDLEAAVQFGAATAANYQQLATAHLRLGNIENAIRQANNALTINPDLAEGWYLRGQAYQANNEFERALNDYTQAITLDGADVEFWVARCALHAQLGDDGSAASDCNQALVLEPTNGFALQQRGLIRERGGDRAGAQADFEEAITYTPTAYQAHYYLGFYALQEQRFDSAINYLSNALSHNDNFGPAYAARGIAYRISGQWNRAVEDLENALNFLPEEIYSYYELGLAKRALADIAYEAGNSSEAQTLYEEANATLQTFIDLSEPESPVLANAQQQLEYVNDALEVVRGQN